MLDKVRRRQIKKAPPEFSERGRARAYREMLLIRRFEEKSGQLYGMGLIGGFCHLYIGQEAVVVGMQMALEEGDQVITAYRDHGHMLACGMDPKGVMAELTGRRGGYSKGKGGSMHMFSVEKEFYRRARHRRRAGAARHGARFRQQIQGQRRVSPHLFRRRRRQPGPGLRELQYGQALEAAGRVRHREQQYAHGHPRRRVSARRPTSRSAALSFDIPGEQVDGMDVRAVKAAGDRAVKWAREGNGPYILEMLTYRYRGHSMSDPAKYRTREEVRRCARNTTRSSRCAGALLEKGRASEDELKAIDKEIRGIVNDAAEFAQNDPEPDVAELYTDVCSQRRASRPSPMR